jgi:hypothetical protein
VESFVGIGQLSQTFINENGKLTLNGIELMDVSTYAIFNSMFWTYEPTSLHQPCGLFTPNKFT